MAGEIAGHRLQPKVSAMRVDRAAVKSNLVGLVLIAPLVLFLAFTFFVPLGRMLTLSVSDTELASVMPRSVVALANWDGKGLPSEDAFEAVGLDLFAARQDRKAGTAARRLVTQRPNFARFCRPPRVACPIPPKSSIGAPRSPVSSRPGATCGFGRQSPMPGAPLPTFMF